MNFIKKNKPLCLLCLLILMAIVFMYLPSIVDGKYFVGGGDVKTQWYPFYVLNRRTTINALKSHTLPFYSFILFLGNNIWASKSSYGLFDIYNLLTYFIRQDYFFIYDLQCLIKIIISGISIYFLTYYLYKNKKVSLVAGLCYALSSYAIYFTSQPSFLSFYSLAPLYLLGIEKYLKENKKILFILIVFFLLITNYYFFYALSLFSPFYFIYRYYNLNKKFKGVLKSAFILILYYVIGVLLSAIVIVPAFFYVIQNERIGGLYYVLSYQDLSIYFHLFISMLAPSHTYIYGNNVFELGQHTLKEICLYSGSLISILLPQMITDKDKSYKISTITLYVLLFLIATIPMLASFMNGFGEPCFRWLFIFIMINIITASRYLTNIEKVNLLNLKISTIFEILLLFTLFISCLNYKNYLLNNYLKQLVLFIIVATFTLLNAFLLTKKNKGFIVLTFIELALFSFIYGFKSSSIAISKNELNMVTSVLADNNDYNNLNNYLNSLEEGNDKEYYRIYVPYDDLYWSFSQNMGIIYNIQGLMTYDSTYEQSFNKMRRMNYAEIVEAMDWCFNIQDHNLMNFLSTKYSITANEETIPFDNYLILDDAYRGSFIVAKNLDYKPLGKTYNQKLTYKEFYEYYQNDTALLNDYVISDSDIKVGKTIAYLNNINYGNNYLSGDINTSQESFMVISLPFDSGWTIKVNGNYVTYYECNGGMLGFNIEKGANHIEMYFIPEGFYVGTILSCIGFMIFGLLLIVSKRKNK